MAITKEDFSLLIQAADAGLLKKLGPGKRRVSMTGRLSMRREDFVKLIQSVGGSWDEHPTWGTSFLIVGDTSIHGYTRKMAEAEDRGTTIITENEFIRMITP
jgi:NAD-dependent DNA ligase